MSIADIRVKFVKKLHSQAAVAVSSSKRRDDALRPLVDLRHHADLVAAFREIILIDAHGVDPKREGRIARGDITANILGLP